MDLDQVLSKWVKLGATFNIAPSKDSPDLEDLIVNSTTHLRDFPRLKGMMLSWLMAHESLVCRHRLASRIRDVASERNTAVLGYILSEVKDKTSTSHYNLAIKECRPLSTFEPLFEVDRKNKQTIDFARKFSEKSSLKWGLWATEERSYERGLRPVQWIMKENPTYHYRALFGGKLQATIIASLLRQPEAGNSETFLAQVCFATRVALRSALDHLEMCGLVERRVNGGKKSITLINQDRLFMAS